jgi:hypothetical protein
MGLVACDQPPSAPSRVPNPAPPEPEPLSLRLAGLVVDGKDRAVPAARVAIHGSNDSTLAETVADAGGVYSVAIDSRRATGLVTVERDGFEPSRHFPFPGGEAAGELKRDLRLHEILRINAGESIDVSIVEGDSSCSAISELEDWTCRRIRVVSPAAGQLTVEVPSHFAQPYCRIQLSNPRSDYSSSLRIAVAAGSETILDVLLIGGSTGTTTLTTRLEPS